MLATRINLINNLPLRPGPVIYWMSRDQRIRDNWALAYAQGQALELKSPLVIAFCLVPEFLDATARQYDFMLKGLEELGKKSAKLNIPFILLTGKPANEIPRLIKTLGSGLLVVDFSPLRINRQWTSEVHSRMGIRFCEVDAHNIVPCRIASQKQEFGAYTIRPKIRRLLNDYLTDIPSVKKHPYSVPNNYPAIDWTRIRKTLKIDTSVGLVDWIRSGESAAHRMLGLFKDERLGKYNERRNDPNAGVVSDLSPYLHFGQISAQHAALEIGRSRKSKSSRDAFLEELIVRRELSDNFCYYNQAYDTFEGFPAWARLTLNMHRNDRRDYIYPMETFETAQTHDPLWNAAQNEMRITGKMHGYMRMYWAKKILEWTPSPEEALAIAIYLNDRYELDGRDPNGYTGIAWSIGGVHDRAWGERPVFGKIRYMSYDGCKRKFDVDMYMRKWER
jgi:deoxyribodipyrimidine photo-lyase